MCLSPKQNISPDTLTSQLPRMSVCLSFPPKVSMPYLEKTLSYYFQFLATDMFKILETDVLLDFTCPRLITSQAGTLPRLSVCLS